ncbi:monocarboxylate transporter 3-like [Lytechinus variegatus]|uniref:monocarboxylate transporter 3-like n=1 Tax=Lytechinus variegatus TaxID=7654 RepID=UPI001BB228B1|nr:monocarboxylate transporter 3-like [Lytechinus variegatus]
MFPIGLVLKLPKEKHKRSPAAVCEHLLEDIDTCSAPSTMAKVHCSDDNVNHTNKVECGILQKGSNILQRSNEKGSPNPDKMAGVYYKMGEESNVGSESDIEMVTEKLESSHSGYTKTQSDPDVDIIKDSTRRKISKKLSSLKTFAEEAKFFLAFILPCDVLGLFTFMSWTLFIVPFAISEGIPEAQAVFVGTMGGVGGLVSRVLGTVILHFHPTWVSGQYVLFCSLTSLMLFLQPLKTSYTYILACSFFLGFGLYGSRCLFEALVSNVVRPDIFPTAISITYLFSGVSGILTAYNSGSLYDMTESYDVVFYILGVLEAVNVGIFLLLLVIKKRLRITQNPDME